MALSVPKFQTKESLSKRLGMTLEQLNETLDFLLKTGLIRQEGDRFLPETMFLHLGNKSPLILRHHTNWRLRALQSLDKERGTDIHYSSVLSLSESDALKLRAMMADFIQEVLERVKPSPEENIFSFCLDFFEA
jgi:hypothetical protein